MTWVKYSDWTEVIVGIEEGVVAAFRVVVKGEPCVGESGELKSMELFDKRASLSAPNKDAKPSLLTMVSLEYVRERDSPPIRVRT